MEEDLGYWIGDGAGVSPTAGKKETSPSAGLVFDALAGQEAFVEVVFDGAHFGDQVGEVREGQQAAAGQYELCGVGFHRDQFLDILARHEAAAHGLAEFVQNQNVEL